MTWKNFTVYIYPDFIRIVFPQDPCLDEQGQKIITMLEKAGFNQKVQTNYPPDRSWSRDRTDFWVEQCTKLAQKFGANVVAPPNITPEAPLAQRGRVPAPHISDPIQQMQEQMAAMQAEILRLREEVEELKKFDAIA